VLLVEDGRTSARATASMLSGGSLVAEVSVAPDVDTALEHLAREPVDLLVLDLNLPGRQGIELLEDVRASGDWSDLPVVVLSGVTDPEIVLRTYELGANCFVRKPRRIVELAPAVRAIEQFWRRQLTPDTNGSVFQLPLAATAESVREARETVRRLLTGWSMTPLADTAQLCTSELATNAVVHAHSPVLLVVSLLKRGVRVEVEDESPGPLHAGDLDGVGESGRGLAIVDALCDCWGVNERAGGKSVWFEVRMPDPE
jgi:CheY-like chemotaxis protein/anti-sigma regulatory factor (Ser/Thr protein kinase)